MQTTRLLLVATLGVGLAAAGGANAQLLGGGAGGGLAGSLTGNLNGATANASGSLAGSSRVTGSVTAPGATGVGSTVGGLAGRATDTIGNTRGRAEDLRAAAGNRVSDVRDRAGDDVRNGVVVARMAGDEAQDSAQAAGRTTIGKIRRASGSAHPSATAEANGDVTIHDSGATANGDGRARR